MLSYFDIVGFDIVDFDIVGFDMFDFDIVDFDIVGFDMFDFGVVDFDMFDFDMFDFDMFDFGVVDFDIVDFDIVDFVDCKIEAIIFIVVNFYFILLEIVNQKNMFLPQMSLELVDECFFSLIFLNKINKLIKYIYTN